MRTLALLALAALLAFAARERTGAASAPALEQSLYVPGEVIVRLSAGAMPAALQDHPGDVRLAAAGAPFVTVRVPPGKEEAAAAIISRQPGVEYAEPNPLKQPSFIPNDPAYPRQWNFKMLGLDKAWDRAWGDDVTIAVLDTGIAFEEWGPFSRSPELSNVVFRDPLNTDPQGQPAHPIDYSGHGTHVTGTLVQDTHDGRGTAGIAPGAAIIPVRVCHPIGCPADDIAEGVRWAVDHGADIINMSLGGPFIASLEREAYEYAEEKGVLVVAAAGNGGPDFIGDAGFDYPAAIETVVAVGAVDVQPKLTTYSNYGDGEGAGVHVVAPGGDLRVDLNNDGYKDGILQNTYAFACNDGPVDYTRFDDCLFRGTSMATPHVSGVAALVLSRFPGLPVDKLRALLACSTKDLGPPGVDPQYGSGLIDAEKALRDSDNDGRPDCVDGPARVAFSSRGGRVEPGGEIEVRIAGFVDGDPIGGYQLTVSFNPDVLTALACEPQPGGECEIHDSSVTFGNTFEDGQGGGFRPGVITFRAAQDPPSFGSYLLFEATAEALLAKDPPPVVTQTPSFIWVQDIPRTVPGDVDCDHRFTAADVALTLGSWAGLPGGFCASYGDVNCSGVTDLVDVMQMLFFLALIQPTVTAGCPEPETPQPPGEATDTPTPGAGAAPP